MSTCTVNAINQPALFLALCSFFFLYLTALRFNDCTTSNDLNY